MSVYDYTMEEMMATYKLKEHHIYGSSRVGMKTDTLEMIGAIMDTSYMTRTLGKKQYEMSNHLGNVLSVVSDKLIPVDDDTDGTTDRYLFEILSAMDYSPFGWCWRIGSLVHRRTGMVLTEWNAMMR
ncbi:MAG TPA: hypothetical protein PK637_17435 [Flavobacteriales bacterium]|nr:hypothetical protein [Flavobacteriales bacterium]HRE98552.1 hypothetical protein [Flavobacteriales bacterium]HRJ39649.1 hypothetical protein [Flavobacteriales bacterium]